MNALACSCCSYFRSRCSRPTSPPRPMIRKVGIEQVESGAKKIPSSKIGEGVEGTAKGIGTTVSEGAKYSGEKLKESGQAAEPPAKTAWGNARDSGVAFGHSVKGFCTNLFSN